MTKELIRDKTALRSLIKKSVNETIAKILDEAPLAPAPAPAPPSPAAPAPAAQQGANDVSVSKVASGQAGSTDSGNDLQKGQITLDMVVEKLNSIRSGRSFRDENITAQMQQYFSDLNDNERLALYAFAKGIAQIVTGEINGQAAVDPSQTQPKIEMTDQGSMQQVRHVKPTIVRKPAPVSPENTAAPSPIVPKQR